MPKTLHKDKLRNFLDDLAQNHRVVAPVTEDGMVFFKAYRTGCEINLDYVNTVVSPKEYLFPQTEKMLSFTNDNQGIELTGELIQTGPQVVFGVRPCDLAGLQALDPVFQEPYSDPNYEARRADTLLIGLGCNAAGATCFCRSFGIDPVVAAGADISFTDLGDDFYVQAFTERGNNLLDIYAGHLASADDGPLRELLEQKRNNLAQMMAEAPELSGVKQYLDQNFEASWWEEMANRCISCGICTFICPTCHCFDIFDVSRGGEGGARFRCWDSCMFKVFTRMAGGHNPRSGKIERVRNRFMHKLSYHHDRYGLGGCVGCGRCIDKCPVNLDIRHFITQIKEAAQNG